LTWNQNILFKIKKKIEFEIKLVLHIKNKQGALIRSHEKHV